MQNNRAGDAKRRQFIANRKAIKKKARSNRHDKPIFESGPASIGIMKPSRANRRRKKNWGPSL